MEAEVLNRLESEIMEIKKMIKRLEIILIGEEDITEEEREELEKRLEEARKGNTISLEEFLRETNVQS